MNKLLFTLGTVLTAFIANAQSAYVLPSPTGAEEPLTIYIDVSQTTGGLKTILTNHPEEVDNVYIWTWRPADNGGNGQWNESAEARKMEHVSGLLFSFYMENPSAFYGVDGPTFFANGISCLAKLKDGNAYPDDGAGEAKTEDLNITIIPKLCDDVYCVFPEIAKIDDFVSITYNNNIETNVNMQNAGDDDIYLYMLAKGTSGFALFPYVAVANVTSTPALKMKPVPGKPGEFRLTIVPVDFFGDLIPANQTITELRFYAVRVGYTPPQPTIEAYGFVSCD